MKIFMYTQLAVPVFQVILFLILSTIALLLGRLRVALFINYCFMLYWGYVANFDLFVAEGVMKLSANTIIYYSIGMVIVLLATIGLIMHNE